MAAGYAKEIVSFGCTVAQGFAAIIYVATEMFRWKSAVRIQPTTPFTLNRPKLLLYLLIGMTCTGGMGFWLVFHPPVRRSIAIVQSTPKDNPPVASLVPKQAEGPLPKYTTELPKRLTRIQEALLTKLVVQYRANNPKLTGTPKELEAINKQLSLAGEPFTITFIKPIYGPPTTQSTGSGIVAIASPGTGIIGPKHVFETDNVTVMGFRDGINVSGSDTAKLKNTHVYGLDTDVKEHPAVLPNSPPTPPKQ